MTFILDHCVWKETKAILSKAGFSSSTLRELGKAEASNGQVIRLARRHKSILITRDSDFTSITHYPLGTHEGIIYLEITPKTITDVHTMLLSALRNTSLETLRGNLLIITPTTFRLHKSE